MIDVKICGVSTAEAVLTAAEAGARWVGFVFYPRSPRAVDPAQAAALAAQVPDGVDRVALLIDADDALVETVVGAVRPALLQLHGAEPPERVAALRARFGVPVMKAVAIAGPDDLDLAAAYEAVADRLLFDAKPPQGLAGALPGGNGRAFDWQLLAARRWSRPWLLSGGLDADNLPQAVGVSGTRAVDVSSGVEDRPGHKDPQRIRQFLDVARSL